MREVTRIFVSIAPKKEFDWQLDYCRKFFSEMIERSGKIESVYEDKELLILKGELYEVTISQVQQHKLGRRFDMIFDFTNNVEYINECLLPTLSNSKFSKWNEYLLDK